VDLCVLLGHLLNEDVVLVSHPVLKNSLKEMSLEYYPVRVVVVVVVVVEHLHNFNFTLRY
jgi:hypothetical protein